MCVRSTLYPMHRQAVQCAILTFCLGRLVVGSCKPPSILRVEGGSAFGARKSPRMAEGFSNFCCLIVQSGTA